MLEPFSDVKEKEAIILENGDMIPTVRTSNSASIRSGAIQITKIPRKTTKILFENDQRGKLKTFQIDETLSGSIENDPMRKTVPTIRRITINDPTSSFSSNCLRILILFFFLLVLGLLVFTYNPTHTRIRETHSTTIRTTVYEIPNGREDTISQGRSILESKIHEIKVTKDAHVLDKDNGTSSNDIDNMNITSQGLEHKDEIHNFADNKDANEDLFEAGINQGIIEEPIIEEDSKAELMSNKEPKIDPEDSMEIQDTLTNNKNPKVVAKVQEVTENDTISINVGFPDMENGEVLLGLGIVSIGAGAAIIASTLWI